MCVQVSRSIYVKDKETSVHSPRVPMSEWLFSGRVYAVELYYLYDNAVPTTEWFDRVKDAVSNFSNALARDHANDPHHDIRPELGLCDAIFLFANRQMTDKCLKYMEKLFKEEYFVYYYTGLSRSCCTYTKHTCVYTHARAHM